MGKFAFQETFIKDLFIVEPMILTDQRGYFMETFNDEFAPYVKHLDGTPCSYVQDNESMSGKGVLRGLHMQLTKPQGKLVRVLQGEIYDAVVDVRKDSATYGQYFGLVLSSQNKKQLLIPEGFLHGFAVLSETAVFSYKCTRLYAPGDEFGVMWNDKELNIPWPVSETEVILADKDKKNHSFRELTEVLGR